MSLKNDDESDSENRENGYEELCEGNNKEIPLDQYNMQQYCDDHTICFHIGT